MKQFLFRSAAAVITLATLLLFGMAALATGASVDPAGLQAGPGLDPTADGGEGVDPTA